MEQRFKVFNKLFLKGRAISKPFIVADEKFMDKIAAKRAIMKQNAKWNKSSARRKGTQGMIRTRIVKIIKKK